MSGKLFCHYLVRHLFVSPQLIEEHLEKTSALNGWNVAVGVSGDSGGGDGGSGIPKIE